MSNNYLKNQLLYVLIFLHNIIYNLLPFFKLKNLYLKLLRNKIGKESYIHIPVRFMHYSKLEIANNVHIGYNCNLDARCGIKIGNNVTIGPYTKLLSIGHDIDDPFYVGKGKTIEIGDNVVFFYDCIVMPGVKIAEGAVVLTGAVVTKDVEPYSVVGGNPAKHLRYRNKDIQYRINQGYWFSC